VIIVRENLKTLAHLRFKRRFAAENGKRGGGNRKTGHDGADIVVPVPPGTLLTDPDTGDVVADLTMPGDRLVILHGGRGGKGNWHYATSTNQAPRYAQPGRPGAERELKVELHLIADIGLVGLPNAGKSTLLSVLTNAHPLIADYPFTTKIPNLGLLREGEREVVLADIPGIIEGASEGKGLGLRFLRHIDRCAALAYLIDLGGPPGMETVRILEAELSRYSPGLAAKPRILVGTKMDLDPDGSRLKELTAAFPAERVLGISAATHAGLAELTRALLAPAGPAV